MAGVLIGDAFASYFSNLYGGLPSGATPGHNDANDAYRHALTAAELARLFGADSARDLMEKHERDNPNTIPGEANMDRWNNEMGVRLYEKWMEEVNRHPVPSLGEEVPSLEKWIYDAVSNGETINNIGDSRRFPDDLLERVAPQKKFDQELNDLLNWARNHRPTRKDPLAFDLNGDGYLESLSGFLCVRHNMKSERTLYAEASQEDAEGERGGA